MAMAAFEHFFAACQPKKLFQGRHVDLLPESSTCEATIGLDPVLSLSSLNCSWIQ